MRSRILLAVLVTVVVLTAVAVRQRHVLSLQQAQVNVLQTQLRDSTQQVSELTASKEQLNRRRAELLRQADDQAAELSRRAATAPVAPSTPPSGGGSNPGGSAPDSGALGKLISGMMNDPDMKRFIQEQQRVMMDQLYAPFVKQLGLTGEEGDRLKGLLAESAVRSTEHGTALIGPAGATNRAALVETMAAEHKQTEEKIKELLGDSRYAQYQAYQLTAPDRMQLNAYKLQAGGAPALSDQQTEQLLGFIQEEKRDFAAIGQPLPGITRAEGMEDALSEERSQALIDNQDAVNQRVLARAKDILTPEQLTSLGNFQTNQLQMMRVGVGMMRKLFPAGTSASPP